MSRNASSMPSRLPFLSRICGIWHNTRCCSIRIFAWWRYRLEGLQLYFSGLRKVIGRQLDARHKKGLEQDAIAVLEWIRTRSPDRNVNVILYGHSIGAGVACFAAANNPHPTLKIKGNRLGNCLYFRLRHASHSLPS